MVLCEPGPADADAMAALHMACWAETYGGLLPASEIARYDLALRRAQWARVLEGGAGRIMRAGNAGFAMMGPQRDAGLATDWPEELYALYLRRAFHGQGLGRALLDAVRVGRFTATVVAGNLRAERFYAVAGGVELSRRAEVIDGMAVTDVVLGFA